MGKKNKNENSYSKIHANRSYKNITLKVNNNKY